MMKLFKKHYMPILTIMIFVSVFLYQLLDLARIPYIQRYSLQNINYFKLLIYTVTVFIAVTILFNIPLLLTIEIAQSFRIPSFRINKLYQDFTSKYKSNDLIIYRHKSYRVFRC